MTLLLTSILHVVIVPWDADQYCSGLSARMNGMNEKVESDLMKTFQVPWKEWVYVDKPCIVMDRYGRILAWIVPELFQATRQVCIAVLFRIQNLPTSND